ncbi:Sedlin, region, partial [Oesophagostomum dentatum]
LNIINDVYQKYTYDLELFVHCSLDIVDEKAPKANEMFLGHLYSNQKYKSYGFITNTGVRMILVLEANNIDMKDLDVRGIFKRFHGLYCSAISNPFYVFGSEIQSKSLTRTAVQILCNSSEM